MSRAPFLRRSEVEGRERIDSIRRRDGAISGHRAKRDRRHRARSAWRRARRIARPLGVRKVHAAADRQPARSARRRESSRRRQDITAVDAVELRRGIGYAIQAVGLFAHMTVAAEHRGRTLAPGLESRQNQRARRRVAAAGRSRSGHLSGPPSERAFGRRGSARRRCARDCRHSRERC